MTQQGSFEVQVFGKRLPPQAEQRIEHAYDTFRANHKHPANLALHAAGYYAILKGLARFFRGKRIRAVLLVLTGLGFVVYGHEIEGTDAFAILKGSPNGRL
jgi:hypothetical protein